MRYYVIKFKNGQFLEIEVKSEWPVPKLMTRPGRTEVINLPFGYSVAPEDVLYIKPIE